MDFNLRVGMPGDTNAGKPSGKPTFCDGRWPLARLRSTWRSPNRLTSSARSAQPPGCFALCCDTDAKYEAVG